MAWSAPTVCPPMMQPADPTEFAAAAAVNGAPADIVALFWTTDGMLWAAADSGVTLERFDGSGWTQVDTGLPRSAASPSRATRCC